MLAVISIHVQDIVTTYDFKKGIVAVFSVHVDGIGTSSNNQQKNFSNYLAHNKSPWSREDNHRRQKSPTQRMSHCFHNSPYYKVLWRWEKRKQKSIYLDFYHLVIFKFLKILVRYQMCETYTHLNLKKMILLFLFKIEHHISL